MAKSRRTLIKIDVECSPQAEESLAEIISALFDVSSFSVEDRERGKFTVSAYLTKVSDLTSERKKLFSEHLENLRKNLSDCGSLKVRYSVLKEKDWAESWKRHFKPLVFGKTLVVKPPWEKRFNIAGAKSVIIDPGLAFGTGNHPTTKFCLQQIVKFRPKQPNFSFLDVGTGSGVLAIAAAKLGYSPVRAFDFDPLAIEVAKKNAKINRVAHKINLHHGDVLKMDVDTGEKYDLICANVSDDILIQAAKRISSLLKENGRLAVAGILKKDFDSVYDAYRAIGLDLVSTKIDKEWKSGLFIKKW